MRRFGSSCPRTFAVVLCLSLTLLLGATAQAAGREKVLYAFTGSTDGAFPSSTLLLDRHGNLYGTTSGGGNQACTYSNSGCGVVFELTPSGKGKWQQQVLYTFQGGADGYWPSGNLVLDASGNLYGTTMYGGSYTVCTSDGCGTVFELSPNGDGTWAKTVIYDFQYTPDGAYPSGLVFEKSGNLYGVTSFGGSSHYGTIYELSPPKRRGGGWTEMTLYTFPGYGYLNPYLVFDAAANLYGAWYEGLQWGGVFELKRTGKTWQETDLYDFLGGGYGGDPTGGVILDGKGHVFGTGAYGGNDFGIAFELKRCADHWAESMIYNFCSLNGCADGATPQGPLLLGPKGVLYGTTTLGGNLACRSYGEGGCGVIFRLARTRSGWQETVVHSFKGPPDGSLPTGGLTPDAKGNLYGATGAGGTGDNGWGYGTVYELTLQSKTVRATVE